MGENYKHIVVSGQTITSIERSSSNISPQMMQFDRCWHLCVMATVCIADMYIQAICHNKKNGGRHGRRDDQRAGETAGTTELAVTTAAFDIAQNVNMASTRIEVKCLGGFELGFYPSLQRLVQVRQIFTQRVLRLAAIGPILKILMEQWLDILSWNSTT